MEQASRTSVEKKLMLLRDRFILRLLQFIGMWASEGVLANMGDVELYADPKSGRTHWSLVVSGMRRRENRARSPPVMSHGRSSCIPICVQLSSRTRVRRHYGAHPLDADSQGRSAKPWPVLRRW